VESFTLAEAAQALGINKASVAPLVARHRLPAEGKGKARRLPRATVEALLARRSQGVGSSTAGYYAREIKAFTSWLAESDRIPKDRLTKLPGAGTASAHRHDRRTPTLAELRGAIAAARVSPRPFRGLSGADRAILYATAAASGFRVEELASLTPESFDLDSANGPLVVLRGDVAKNGLLAEQPLPPDLAEALRSHLADRPAGQPVWPGTCHEKAAAMLRRDLDAAGIPYATDGPEGPLYLDFHALRHGYVALLDKAGATLKEAMSLARHTDPKLTMARYGRAHLHDLAAAVGRLPGLLSEGPDAQGGDAAPPADQRRA
jgi:excisionase family DNA binding protein